MNKESIEFVCSHRRKPAIETLSKYLEEINLKSEFMLTTGFYPWLFCTRSGSQVRTNTGLSRKPRCHSTARTNLSTCNN